MTAREEHVGKRAKCPHCGSIITIEEEVILQEAGPSDTHFKAITLEMGHLHSPSGYISISIKVTDEGKGFVLLYACESNTRRKGELLSLTLEEFRNLNDLLQKVAQTITQLQASKQMLKLDR